MPRVETTVQVQATPEQVWKLMCDTHQYAEWVVPTDEVTDPGEGEMGVGYVYRERGGLAPFKGNSTWTVTEFTPHSWQRHIGDDGATEIDLGIRIAPVASGSTLTLSLDIKPRWFLAPVMALMWPLMMRKRAQQAMDGTSANAKKLLEA